ncbi:MAG: PHP domain-containing protein [Candidatus Omnitrophica bacterium]|nr:PHP domain-containing protein [Candidatus Omnitrophota bacterium]MDD5429180.1 PHP domain-containing protein [Candidatus Omnitrophota bacterium]
MSESARQLCDLHIHSIFSDSDADIESIFKQAKEKNLHCIAITDHDTVSGIPLARDCSRRYGIELIEGLELSAQHQGIEIHVLGYFVDSESEYLNEQLDSMRGLRKQRILDMAKALNAIGVEVDIEELLEAIGAAMPTRLHLGLYLLGKGKVSNLWEAFKKYLTPGKPAYVAGFKYSVKDAIEVIKKSGGLSFLAHPHMISNQAWVREFINFGLDGLEINYSSMSPVKKFLYTQMASKHNLLKSGGSDAHGSYKEFTQIGKVTVPYEWVQAMKGRLKNKK